MNGCGEHHHWRSMRIGTKKAKRLQKYSNYREQRWTHLINAKRKKTRSVRYEWTLLKHAGLVALARGDGVCGDFLCMTMGVLEAE